VDKRLDCEFTLPIAAVAGESLEIDLFEYNPNKADEMLRHGCFALEEFGFGRVCESPIVIPNIPEITLRAHFAPPRAVPFVESPFSLPRVRVIVGEAVGIAVSANDIGYRVSVDAVSHEGKKTESTPPQWFGVHDLLVLNERGEVRIVVWMKSKKQSHDAFCEVAIPLTHLPRDGPLIGWWPLPDIGGTDTKMNIAVQWIIEGAQVIDLKTFEMSPIPPELVSRS
jgi:hypothetical protein